MRSEERRKEGGEEKRRGSWLPSPNCLAGSDIAFIQLDYAPCKEHVAHKTVQLRCGTGQQPSLNNLRLSVFLTIGAVEMGCYCCYCCSYCWLRRSRHGSDVCVV